MRPDEQALVKAIAANLDAYVPRPEYADWLDETAKLVEPQFT